MNKMFAMLIGSTLGMMALTAQAGVVDLNLGNDSFRAGYTDALANILPGTNGQYDAGVIARPRKSDDFYQAHVGLLLTGDVGSQQLNVTAGLGGRLLYVYKDSKNGGALAVGGQLAAKLPQYNRLGLSASSYYAPNILTVGRLDRSWENTVDLDYELIRNGNVYVGYRNLRQDVDGHRGTTDNGFHAGFRLKF